MDNLAEAIEKPREYKYRAEFRCPGCDTVLIILERDTPFEQGHANDYRCECANPECAGQIGRLHTDKEIMEHVPKPDVASRRDAITAQIEAAKESKEPVPAIFDLLEQMRDYLAPPE